MVLRIAAPHLLSDLAVAVGPEGRQVLCDLQGTVSGGEEVQGQRHRLIENPRRRLQAEDFLKSHAQNWAVSGSVVDRKAAAAGNIVMGWRQSVEIAPLAPVEQAGQEIPDNERLKMLPASSAVDGRSEPVFETSQQSFIGDVGPVVGALPVQERQSVAVSVISVGPGQHRKPLPPNAG